MKKSLSAIAALGLAATANAQSHVSLSGTVDAAFAHVKGDTASRDQLVSGSNLSSKLYFRGTEDLGGQLRQLLAGGRLQHG